MKSSGAMMQTFVKYCHIYMQCFTIESFGNSMEILTRQNSECFAISFGLKGLMFAVSSVTERGLVVFARWRHTFPLASLAY